MSAVLQSTPARAAPMPQGFHRCSHVAPRPERGTQRYTYTLNGIGLECDIEFEAADGDGWNEPREPATATLCKAWVRDVDVYELLDDEQREEIETAFLSQEPDYDDCPEPDFAE